MTAHLTAIYFRSRCLLVLCLLLLSINACQVQNIAGNDAAVRPEIIRIAKQVDLFWTRLLDTSANRRDYNSSKQDYLEIESELRSLVFQHEIHKQNAQSIDQANMALASWLKVKGVHKKSNRFENYDVKSHRQQFKQIFTAMAKGEELKLLTPSKTTAPGPAP